MGYYFISIGGSGAKVMESLTHLCAAGLLPNFEKRERLYVMSVDPDLGNGNLNRSSASLRSFVNCQDFEVGVETSLFKTPVELASPFTWSPIEHNKKLDDVMSYQAHRKTPIGDLYETLYTQQERDQLLNEGFRGRPSIGAAVLAQKASLFSKRGWENHAEEPWRTLADRVRSEANNGQKAHIFLAGSVFGGTGAAGMPTIAHLLRQEFHEECEAGNVLIGGGFILPYFSFSPTTAANTNGIFASSENFLMNTRAALKYYSVKDKSYDAMYFVGDEGMDKVNHFSVGAADQKNDAHIVDLYAALAAVDFFSRESIQSGERCSYIAHADKTHFTWTDLPSIKMADGKSVEPKECVGHFVRFIFSYLHLIQPVLNDLANGNVPEHAYPWYIDYLKTEKLDTAEIKSFTDYAVSFVNWLGQLENTSNNRGIDLVKRTAFQVTDDPDQPVLIDANEFDTCIVDEKSIVTIHEIWTRLAENYAGDGADRARGFGLFLRTLYDCCYSEA